MDSKYSEYVPPPIEDNDMVDTIIQWACKKLHDDYTLMYGDGGPTGGQYMGYETVRVLIGALAEGDEEWIRRYYDDQAGDRKLWADAMPLAKWYYCLSRNYNYRYEVPGIHGGI